VTDELAAVFTFCAGEFCASADEPTKVQTASHKLQHATTPANWERSIFERSIVAAYGSGHKDGVKRRG
jgi:hypothetical protein